MIRQRVHLRRVGVGEVILRVLVTALGLALMFYGAMALLAALKLAPSTINSISAYRTIEHALQSITAHNITGTDRIITAAAGVACLLIFAPLCWRALPRPYLARTPATLPDQPDPGTTEIAPRALERAVELAAQGDPRVQRARARSNADVVELDVELGDLDGELLSPLSELQQRVRHRLGEQGLPPVRIDVTLTGATVHTLEKENHS